MNKKILYLLKMVKGHRSEGNKGKNMNSTKKKKIVSSKNSHNFSLCKENDLHKIQNKMLEENPMCMVIIIVVAVSQPHAGIN